MKNSRAFIILLSCLALGNGQDSVSFLDPNCGVARISGDRIADKFKNPWMAYISTTYPCIMYPGSTCESGCGGSLIAPRFVLSAAHCKFSPNTTITLGTYDRSKHLPNSIDVPANAQIRHPFYSKRDESIKHDIALYRLAWAVSYTEYIKPICLATNYNPLERLTYLTATGWGKTEFAKSSNKLRTITLRQHDRRKCSQTFGENVDMSQICAGSSTSPLCEGDSGGPILFTKRIDGRNRVIQLGVVSYGATDCQSVTVLTNVMYYMNWIVEIARTTRSPIESY